MVSSLRIGRTLRFFAVLVYHTREDREENGMGKKGGNANLDSKNCFLPIDSLATLCKDNQMIVKPILYLTQEIKEASAIKSTETL